MFKLTSNCSVSAVPLYFIFSDIKVYVSLFRAVLSA